VFSVSAVIRWLSYIKYFPLLLYWRKDIFFQERWEDRLRHSLQSDLSNGLLWFVPIVAVDGFRLFPEIILKLSKVIVPANTAFVLIISGVFASVGRMQVRKMWK